MTNAVENYTRENLVDHLSRMAYYGIAAATGKSADFIVLNANPLDDINNTRQIDSVYLRGDAVDRNRLRVR
jgi:hypothetical protein